MKVGRSVGNTFTFQAFFLRFWTFWKKLGSWKLQIIKLFEDNVDQKKDISKIFFSS